MKNKNFFLLLSIVSIFFAVGQCFAASYDLAMEVTSDGSTPATDFEPGEYVYVSISLANGDSPEQIAGFAATIETNDSSGVLISPTANTYNADGSINTNYGQITSTFPFVFTKTGHADSGKHTHRENVSSGKIYLAGAEINTGDGGAKTHANDAELFTLRYQVSGSATSGATFSFTLKNTTGLTSGGYDGSSSYPNGGPPVLVGSASQSDGGWSNLDNTSCSSVASCAFPIYKTTINKSSVTCNVVGITYEQWKTDNGWFYIGSENDDWDKDGYTNAQEKVNGTDPTEMNSSGGTNYDSSTDIRLADLTVDFGGSGVYTYDRSTWVRIAEANPQIMATWGTNLIIDFGTQYGLWLHDGFSWGSSKIADLIPDQIVDWDDKFIGDFGTKGIWTYNGTWEKIATSNPDNMVRWGDKIVFDLGSTGVYSYDGTWTKIADVNPAIMGTWYENLIVDFGTQYGLWINDGTTWSKIADLIPDQILDWGDKMVGDFGTKGVWTYDGTWEKIASVNPQIMAIWGKNLISDFGSAYGLWRHDGTSWGTSKIADLIPQVIVDWGDRFAGDFGASGLWTYDGTWSKIASVDSDLMVIWP